MINQIMTEGYKDINPRPKYADGTPAYYFCKSYFRTYDLRRISLFVLYVHRLGKLVLKEIFTIYQKPTNNIEEMREMGVGLVG